jgi:hypothetical protein
MDRLILSWVLMVSLLALSVWGGPWPLGVIAVGCTVALGWLIFDDLQRDDEAD